VAGQLAEFGRDHFVVAPDMRGYNLSSKPKELESYAVPLLVEDLVALAEHLGHRRFTLVAHDWAAPSPGPSRSCIPTGSSAW
jgi:pimeloyl-ACP methyl ester carboxylesterase